MKRLLITSLAATGMAATAVFAGGHSASPEEKAVQARIAHMNLYSFNLNVLGAMAKGDTEYNAELASALAADLSSLSQISEAAYWPPGTSTDDMKGTRALAVAWEKMDDTMMKAGALVEASTALAAAAGTLEGLQGGIGAVGAACGACHKATRAPKN